MVGKNIAYEGTLTDTIQIAEAVRSLPGVFQQGRFAFRRGSPESKSLISHFSPNVSGIHLLKTNLTEEGCNENIANAVRYVGMPFAEAFEEARSYFRSLPAHTMEFGAHNPSQIKAVIDSFEALDGRGYRAWKISTGARGELARFTVHPANGATPAHARISVQPGFSGQNAIQMWFGPLVAAQDPNAPEMPRVSEERKYAGSHTGRFATNYATVKGLE